MGEELYNVIYFRFYQMLVEIKEEIFDYIKDVEKFNEEDFKVQTKDKSDFPSG